MWSKNQFWSQFLVLPDFLLTLANFWPILELFIGVDWYLDLDWNQLNWPVQSNLLNYGYNNLPDCWCPQFGHWIRQSKGSVTKLPMPTASMTKGLFGFPCFHHSLPNFYHLSLKNEGTYGDAACLDLFSSFVSITQFSHFWGMSYKNWKQVLGVFKLWKLSYDGIFVNTHTCEGPTVRALSP